MANTNVNVAGIVKFFSAEKGFGIITINPAANPADVFIHVSKCAGKQAELVSGAKVRIDYVTAYKDGQYKHSATALLSVKAPPAPVEVLDVVKFYDDKRNFGFIFCSGHNFSKDEAVLRSGVAKKAGIIPGKGMPVRALVLQKPEGPEVLSFEWGPEVEAAYAAKLAELHAEDGASTDGELASAGVETVDATDRVEQALALTSPADTLADQCDTGVLEAIAAKREVGVAVIPAKPKRAAKKPKAEPSEAATAKPKKPVVKKPRAVKPAVDTPVVVAADRPDGPMAGQLAALGLNGTGVTAH